MSEKKVNKSSRNHNNVYQYKEKFKISRIPDPLHAVYSER